MVLGLRETLSFLPDTDFADASSTWAVFTFLGICFHNTFIITLGLICMFWGFLPMFVEDHTQLWTGPDAKILIGVSVLSGFFFTFNRSLSESLPGSARFFRFLYEWTWSSAKIWGFVVFLILIMVPWYRNEPANENIKEEYQVFTLR